jgi:hypothetical protein
MLARLQGEKESTGKGTIRKNWVKTSTVHKVHREAHYVRIHQSKKSKRPIAPYISHLKSEIERKREKEIFWFSGFLIFFFVSFSSPYLFFHGEIERESFVGGKHRGELRGWQ